MSFMPSVTFAASQALLSGALLILGGCGGGKAASPAPTPTVEVATVIQRDTPIYTEWVATLDGYVNAEIQPRVSGYIIKQNYKEGAVVRKGDVLFEIDPRPLRAALDQAQAQLAQAEAQLGKASLDVERDTPLAEARAIAQSQLDTEVQAKLGAEASVLAAKANVEQAELNLEFTRVTSLVTGIAGKTEPSQQVCNDCRTDSRHRLSTTTERLPVTSASLRFAPARYPRTLRQSGLERRAKDEGVAMAACTALGSVADIESFIIEYYAAWGGTDEDRIMSYYAQGVTVQIPGSLMQGKSALREQFVRPFITGFPGNRHVVKNMIIGPDVVVVEFTFEADHKGPFAGRAATDARVELPGTGVYEYDSATRQITAARIYFDVGTLLKQIIDQRQTHSRTEEAAAAPASTIAAPFEHLDLATVITVSQTVSGEMLLENLLDT